MAVTVMDPARPHTRTDSGTPSSIRGRREPVPLFAFQCTFCGLEFDVSRPGDDPEGVDCPLDGEPAGPIFSVPMPLFRSGAEALDWAAFKDGIIRDHGHLH